MYFIHSISILDKAEQSSVRSYSRTQSYTIPTSALRTIHPAITPITQTRPPALLSSPVQPNCRVRRENNRRPAMYASFSWPADVSMREVISTFDSLLTESEYVLSRVTQKFMPGFGAQK